MKKIVSIMVVLATMFTLAGCGQPAQDVKDTENQTVTDKSFEDIKAKGKIVVGLDISFPPMGFKDEAGKIVGFDVDMAEAAAEKMGLKVELKPIDWTAKETELNMKNIDLIWNGYTITDERKQKVLFTKPYLGNKQVIVVMDASGIKDKAGLEGKKVGFQSGSSAEDAIKGDEGTYNKIKDKMRGFDDNTIAMMDLKAGGVDAVVMDEVVADYYISKNPGNYVILTEDFGSEEYGVGARKGDVAFMKELQKALDEMKADGTSKEISNKWFGKDNVL